MSEPDGRLQKVDFEVRPVSLKTQIRPDRLTQEDGMGIEPKNKLFTEAMVSRIRAFAHGKERTEPAHIAEMLQAEFGEFRTEKQICSLAWRRKIALGGQARNPIAVWPAACARIAELVRSASPPTNPALVLLVKTEFGYVITPGQLSGYLHRAGLCVRGNKAGPRRSQRRTKQAAEFIGKLAAAIAPLFPVVTPRAKVRRTVMSVPIVAAPAPPPRPVVWRAPASPRPLRACLWPDPCDQPVWQTRPYCAGHCQISYVGFKAEAITGQNNSAL